MALILDTGPVLALLDADDRSVLWITTPRSSKTGRSARR
jgi:hypothetical protein